MLPRDHPDCPECGARHAAKIIYGLQEIGEKLKQQLEEGSVVLGGCFFDEKSRDWHCHTCGHEWGDELSKNLERVHHEHLEREALKDAEAQKRGVLTAYLRPDGWTKCPYCKMNFATYAGSWDGEKHTSCRTRLKLIPVRK
jgi:hypothetical protein